MKILLINNHTAHLKELAEALRGHDVEVQTYLPGIKFKTDDKDLVILSGGGGEGLEIYDHYERGKLWYGPEMSFIRNYQGPILGICMGFEVVCSAFGEKIQHMGRLVEGYKTVGTTDAGYQLTGQKSLKQYESHRWNVPHVSEENFEVLARSDSGVEMIRHKRRPILATQFHPEMEGGTLDLDQILASFKMLTPTIVVD